MVPSHPCTAYCSHPRHVDLVHYKPGAWTDAEIARHLVESYAEEDVAIIVDRVEPAREAPERPHGVAHLVWWRVVH